MNLLQMSLSGGLVILVVALLRAFTLNRLPKSTFLLLWGVAVFRLLAPVSVPSMFSVYTLADRVCARAAGHAAPLPTAAAGADALPFVPGALPAGPAATPESGSPLPVLPCIWLAGALVCGGYFLAAYLRCRLIFRTALPAGSEWLRGWLQNRPLRRGIRLRQTDRIRTPLTYGLLRPVILLPKTTDWEDTTRLAFVLEHELVHIQRMDALWKLVLVLTACVHWFNPLVWGMLVLAGRDMELRCDETVVRRMGLDRRSEYARALIRMEERKSGFGPLVSAFSKTAVEERIVAIMKIRKTSFAALLAALLLVFCVGAGFATSAAAETTAPYPDAPGGEFTAEELERLARLWFEGYETLTVADYQQKMWAERDTPEDLALIERYSQYLARAYGHPDTHMTAQGEAFAAYFQTVYEPLTAEQWQKRVFSGEVGDQLQNGAAVLLEYSCYLRILSPETLTAGEYRQAYDDVKAAVFALAEGYLSQGPSDLARQTGMQDIDCTALSEALSTDRLNITIQGGVLLWGFTSDNGQQNGQEQPGAHPENPDEQREFPRATRADYDAILTLRTDGWQQMSLAVFNQQLLDWANEHPDAYDRLNCDVLWNDYGVKLTGEERSFVALTCALSGAENGMRIRALYTGRPEEDVRLSASLPERTAGQNGMTTAWCDLYYDISYHIDDRSAVTVAQRDRGVSRMLARIEAFWQGSDLEDLLGMTEEDVVRQLGSMVEQVNEFDFGQGNNSPAAIWFNPVTADSIQFERMDERGTAFA